MTAASLALVLLFGLATPAAADDDSIARGKQLAQEMCAECHVVNGSGGSDAVPTLHALANTPGMTRDRVRAFVYDPHPQMPALQIPTRDMDDLVAYIFSLRD
jgi:mono/diheme cytochrome c family protein